MQTNFRILLISTMLFGLWVQNLSAEEQIAPAKPQEVKVHLQSRSKDGKASIREEGWKPSETAIIICDMWDQMPCIPVEARANELAKEIEKVITAARDQGVLIIHAPSGDLEDFDKNYPEKPQARETSKEFRKGFGNAKHWDAWEHSSPEEEGVRFPVEVGDGGCQRPECKDRTFSARQSRFITIKDNDVLTDDFVEIKDYTKAKGIKNIILMGVHTNMCIIGRPFGLRAMKKAGYNVTLMRDMTDVSYNNDFPQTVTWPNVDHFAGLELVVEHIEKYICPTLLSTDFTGKPAFRFSESIKKDNSDFAQETSTGWVKYENNPVLGGANLGTCFDVSLIQEDGLFKMWFSWRPKKSIAYTESKDGINWSEPKIVLAPNPDTDWENDLNRPGILKRDGIYHLWYTGQAKWKSRIGYAVSSDGIKFERKSDKPVLSPDQGWELNIAVMCPHVEWDAQNKIFKMWYSGGEQYEPNAIGYATSQDGLVWEKLKTNPIFTADKTIKWEQHKVTACQVLQHGDWWYMFYIGFENEHLARIGIARSRDGITNWERLPTNPIISPGENKWDASACYKPFAIFDSAEKKWRLWYNGRNKQLERIGLAIHDGEDLGFPPACAANFVTGDKILFPFPY
ncbi:MAG: isochorismatase family protein [Planctomycetaceae bacterium]|jgi:nicotinamidase-related amidase/predicted GH43/DUF377 family glycosyl hydrolase|nr:isochorismatase family protein [Planctomycetaceae bacterium]